MLNMACNTKLSTEQITVQLKRFFGEGGLGLELREETPQCLAFEGGGGYVTATLCPEGVQTRVEMITQEWEHQVRQFASEIS